MMTPELGAELADLAREERILVVLDFDGTISPIVPVPSDARPLPGALDRLEQLGAIPGTEVFLLSGRARADLAQVSGAGRVAGLIGSHGQESGADVPLTAQESALLTGIRAEVMSTVAGLPGIRVEDKPAGLAVHVRGMPDTQGAEATEQVRAIAHRTEGTFCLEGKLVIEIAVRPLDKGSALRALIDADPDRRVLFAGDDVTDESAMAVLRSTDVGIRVGSGESLAQHRVAGPPEMVEVLGTLARLRGGDGEGPGAS